MIETYLRDAAGVERGGPFAAGGFEELGFGDENKVRVRVYEPLDEPGAGDAVHLDVLTSDPFHDGSPFRRSLRSAERPIKSLSQLHTAIEKFVIR